MAQKNQVNIYQFKITLQYIKPAIWRRIQVPGSYSFWDLHCAIQDSMGWDDSHLHEFVIFNPKSGIENRIGLPCDGWEDLDLLTGWETKISSYFSLENKKAIYTYDFGDGWSHQVVLEKILPIDPQLQYPHCSAGKRACPPEDCGGVPGYECLLQAMSDPRHPEYKNYIEWLGCKFDSEKFNSAFIRFNNPSRRLKMSLQ